MKTYIINPKTQKAVTIDEWKKEPDPTTAEFVLLETDEEKYLVICKSPSPNKMNFDDASAYANARQYEGAPMRCPKRKEALDIYDARFTAGLDEAMKLIGGRVISYEYWTCERDADPRCYANYAWCSGGGYGYARNNYLYLSILALPLLLLDARKAASLFF